MTHGASRASFVSQDLASTRATSSAAVALMVPDAQGIMAKASELVYNDAPWVPHQRARFVHARLSHQVR